MPGAMPTAVPRDRSRRRIGVSPITALLGVYGSTGESRTRATVRRRLRAREVGQRARPGPFHQRLRRGGASESARDGE